MAVFTDKRGRRFQNDIFTGVKEGDTIMTEGAGFYGKIHSSPKADTFEVVWSHVNTPDTFYSKGEYPTAMMERDKVMLEIKRPTIIIC